MTTSPVRIFLLTAVLACAWGISSYVAADRYYKAQIGDLVARESLQAAEHADDLADSIRRNLHYLSGIPDLLDQGPRVLRAAARFGAGTRPSALPYEVRKKRWTKDRALNEIDRFLASAQESLNADLILVMDAAGDCIAAGNWDTDGSPIGTNLAEREFFQENRAGRRGMQYAVGKTTHLAGLYFSSPIIIDGKFMGAVVAKANVAKLSFLTKQIDAFLTDKNGVILLAYHKSIEMHALPDAPLRRLSAQEIFDRYRIREFPTVHMEPWNDGEFPMVQRTEGEATPHVLATKELPEYALTLHVEGELPALPLLEQDRLWVPLWIGGAGMLLIVIGGAAAHYLYAIRRARGELSTSQSQLAALLHTSKDAVIGMDGRGAVTIWNDAAEEMFGWRRGEILGRPLHHFIIPERYREQHVRGLTAFEGKGRGDVVNSRIEIFAQHRDGREFPVELSITQFRNGERKEFGAFVRDITARRQAEAELRIASVAFESQEGVMITDANGRILRVNQAFTDCSGYSAEELMGQTPRILKSGRHDSAFYAAMWESIRRTGAWQGEIWDRRKNGEIYPKWLTVTAIKDAEGNVTHYVGTQTDITERKSAEEEIRHLAFYDPLTGLPNRRLLMDRFHQALAASARHGREGAVLFIDLDNFKTLNDTRGHDQGDKLLLEVAQRLKSCVREGDTVARLGGDEFVVMLEDFDGHEVEAAEHAEAVAHKILGVLNQPYQLGGHDYRTTASIGAVMFAGHRQPIDELMKQADIAMYQAKQAGRNTLRFFDPRMQEAIYARVTLERELRAALENREFCLYYQVQVDDWGHAFGAEALLRWQHPERGMVSPGQFVPLAEETGLILPIGQWVLDSACAQLKAWEQSAATRDLLLSINVSAKQLRQADFVAQLTGAVERHGVRPHRLKLELTESMLFDNVEAVINTMSALKQLGVRISLDDFGTGYSSLQYLKRLPLDQLKIDQSFVRDIPVDANDRAIVSTIIAMARHLNLDVIAEGVETELQREFLRRMDCAHFQGYLFGRPLPLAEFEASLKHV